MSAVLQFAIAHPLIAVAWWLLLAGCIFDAFERRAGMRS